VLTSDLYPDGAIAIAQSSGVIIRSIAAETVVAAEGQQEGRGAECLQAVGGHGGPDQDSDGRDPAVRKRRS